MAIFQVWGYGMGWRGALRTMAAAARAAERDERRRQRALEQQQRHIAKMEELEQAAHEVEVYLNYVDRITSVHKETRARVDWPTILNDSQPAEPHERHENRDLAEHKLQSFRPTLLQKALKTAEKKRANLQDAVRKAIEQDKEEYRIRMKSYLSDLTEWKEQTELARDILAKKPDAYTKALKELGSFSEIAELGSQLEFRVTDDGMVFGKVKVHSKDIVPTQSKSLLKSGKLSQKDMPKGEFFELYQDYVCGAVLRVANEVLAILPIESVVVTACDDLLDSSTGHIAEQVIVSAYIPRATIQNLNMDRIDPSESFSNFVHKMDFKKTKGFSPVEEVSPPGHH